MSPSAADPSIMLRSLRGIVEPAYDDVGGCWYVRDYAPDSSEYGGSTEPGSAWSEKCDLLLAEIRTALPPGWEASWSDDDLRIDSDNPMESHRIDITTDGLTGEQIGELLDAGLITHGTYLAALGRGFAAPFAHAWSVYLREARAKCLRALARREERTLAHPGLSPDAADRAVARSNLIGRMRARLPGLVDRDRFDDRVASLCVAADGGDEAAVAELLAIEADGSQRR